MAINAKKEDVVKIENHCIKKNRLGFLSINILKGVRDEARGSREYTNTQKNNLEQ